VILFVVNFPKGGIAPPFFQIWLKNIRYASKHLSAGSSLQVVAFSR
jgi:hypothetical protein